MALRAKNRLLSVGILRLAKFLANPARLLRRLLLLAPRLPFMLKVEADLYDRPHYAYGLSRAAQQAKALNIPAISCIEFGVGSGAGLLSLESIAAEVEAATGVRIEVYGFDTGRGLPPPEDYRDLPYLYRGGFYPMDEQALRNRLQRAELVLGDVAETAPEFRSTHAAAPIGFISFDLDYYSSTARAFKIFDGDLDRFLPRVLCYFDDISNAEALQCDFTGEALAIAEFNDMREEAKIDRVAGLSESRAIPMPWNRQIYACHFFHHTLYNEHVIEEAEGYVPPLE